MERKRVRRRRRRRKLAKRRILLFLSIILLTFISAGGYLFYQTYQAASESYDDLGREKSPLRDEAVSVSKDPISILLMGVEDYSTEGSNGRSDTLMVATFNPDDEELKLLSIPRDTLVDIAGRDQRTKINHAFAYGGKEMTIATVENFLNIPIDYYATVNFDGFKNIVDVLGGITVDVPFDFQQNSDDRVAEKLQFYEGEMTLNGRYALAYARMRYEDPRGDIGRNERQKEVVQAVISKLMSPGTIAKADDLANELGSNIETNMKMTEALKFYKSYADFSMSNISQLTLQGSDTYVDGVYYYQADPTSLANIQNELRAHLDLAEAADKESTATTTY